MKTWRQNELTLKASVHKRKIRRQRIDPWGTAISKALRTDQHRQQRGWQLVTEEPGQRVAVLEAAGRKCLEEVGGGV